MGVDMTEVSRSLVASTSSSRFIVPNYWADPNSGIAYQIQVQVPQAEMSSVEALENVPVAFHDGQPILLRNLAKITPGTTPGQYQRFNMQRMVTVTANIEGAALGSGSRIGTHRLTQRPPRAIRYLVLIRVDRAVGRFYTGLAGMINLLS